MRRGAYRDKAVKRSKYRAAKKKTCSASSAKNHQLVRPLAPHPCVVCVSRGMRVRGRGAAAYSEKATESVTQANQRTTSAVDGEVSGRSRYLSAKAGDCGGGGGVPGARRESKGT